MIYLDNILEYINQSIQLPTSVNKRMYKLAEVASFELDGKKKVLPFVKGEGIELLDSVQITSYHKILNESFSKIQGYGSKDYTVQKASMQLVVVNLDHEINTHNLAAIIADSFSVGYLNTNLGLNVQRIGLDLQGITYQTYSLLKSDFGLERNDLRANAFAINYTIECVYLGDCINICC